MPTDRRPLATAAPLRLIEETVEEPERQVGAMVGFLQAFGEGEMKTLIAVAALSLAAILPANASKSPKYWHNGSLMEAYFGRNGSMIISYLEPKPVLQSIGVRPGTELVSGYWHNDSFVGTARIFSRCGEMGYRVTGTAVGHMMVLEGPAPIIYTDCSVGGWGWTHNSHLEFIDEDHEEASDPRQVAPRVEVTLLLQDRQDGYAL